MKKSHSNIQKPIVIKKTSETCEKRQDGNEIMITKTLKTTFFTVSESLQRFGPINFNEFIEKLEDYKVLVAKGEEMMKDSDVNTPKFGTITQNLIFNDGVTKLLKVIFMSEEDATTSIKVAIQRAFPQISATIKNRYKSKDGTKIISIGYDCTKSVHKKSDKKSPQSVKSMKGVKSVIGKLYSFPWMMATTYSQK